MKIQGRTVCTSEPYHKASDPEAHMARFIHPLAGQGTSEFSTQPLVAGIH